METEQGPLLIVGAQPDSLGAEVASLFTPTTCLTAGLSVHEDFQMDVREPQSIREVLDHVAPHSILVTAGINVGEPLGQKGFTSHLGRSMDVNFIGVMEVLNQWVSLEGKGFEDRAQFVAISSNSAHIARRGSVAYCASKAALSMGLRCAARELAGRPFVYGYELGLLRGTPMTAATEARFGAAQTRMVGAPDGLNKHEVARTIKHNLMDPHMGLNGALLRIDAGEQ